MSAYPAAALAGAAPGRLPDKGPIVNQEERRQFVRDHRTCIFGYARKADGPAMTVVYYVMNGDSELLVSTMAARAKARAVARTGFINPPALSGAELDAPRKDK